VPFLRVIRDKRGYETTYLMHWYREGTRQRSRILYVFRSPGGVRVGRDPLEPDTLRQLEAQHPDIAFDWKIVRDNQQIVETAQEPRRRRTPRPDESEAVAAPPPPRSAEPLPVPARPPLPARIEGDTPDAQISFLTELYPVIRERIPQRTQDPSRQEILLALAERLNPAAWTDADQITTGLQQAAEALERLSHVFAKRRRRGRKKSRGATESAGDSMSTTTEGAPGDATDESDAIELPDTDENSSLE
jgi:hypothetical protein